METLIVLTLAIIVISGTLAFSGGTNKVSTTARSVFFVGLVVLLALAVGYFVT